MKKKTGEPSNKDDSPEVESEDEDRPLGAFHFFSTVSYIIYLDIHSEYWSLLPQIQPLVLITINQTPGCTPELHHIDHCHNSTTAAANEIFQHASSITISFKSTSMPQDFDVSNDDNKASGQGCIQASWKMLPWLPSVTLKEPFFSKKLEMLKLHQDLNPKSQPKTSDFEDPQAQAILLWSMAEYKVLVCIFNTFSDESLKAK